MRTDELVTMLATGSGGVQLQSAKRRVGVAILWGIGGAGILMLLFLGVRPDISGAVLQPMFWTKIAFAASLAAIGVTISTRLSIPGRELGVLPATVAVPILALWGLATFVLVTAPPGTRSALFFGQTWTKCPILIAMLSVPVFLALCRAMKQLAPTRLRLAGAACGFASGGIATTVYSMHCPEMAAPFIAFWYLLGMLVPTATGALLGPRLLRW
jgi:hypothetical protein